MLQCFVCFPIPKVSEKRGNRSKFHSERNYYSQNWYFNDLSENLVKTYCCGLSVCKMEVTQYTLSTHQTVAISVVLAYLFCHHKRVNQGCGSLVYDDNYQFGSTFTTYGPLLTAEDFWFFCDLYLQFIAPINLWNKSIDLRLFLKCKERPYLRPLRSKDNRC